MGFPDHRSESHSMRMGYVWESLSQKGEGRSGRGVLDSSL